MKKFFIIISFFLLITTLKGGGEMNFTTTSFNPGDFIPSKYTCDGIDISPELKWSGAPQGTKSFVLIMDDPDAPVGTWDHWVVYNIPASVTELPEGVNIESIGAIHGRNSWPSDNERYRGPCPPPGKPHRYFFKLYAVDIPTNFNKGLTKKEVLNRIEGHILDKAEFYGLYSR